MRRQPPGPFFSTFLDKVSGESVLRLFMPFRLRRVCERRSCCCRCLVVGKIAVVPIVLSVAGDVAGGESVFDVSELRGLRLSSCCGRCTCHCRPRCSIGGGLPAVLTVVVVVPVCCSV